MLNIIGYLRSLSFGGVMGSGIAAYLYLRYPHWFKDNVTFEYFTVFGGLFGASIHNTIGAVVVAFLFPIVKFADYYSRMIQLSLLGRLNVLDEKTSRSITEELSKAYFLKVENDNKQLPNK
jgi:hypothetical protein